MQKIHHAFISSTYSDLKDERRAVSEAVAKAGFVPEGMELFPASSLKQFEFIKTVIDRCDYYVVIVGGRYGSLADGNVSYTEMEYDYATTQGISTLAFIHSHPEKIETGKTDTSSDLAKSLEAFRERLKAAGMVAFWEDPGTLATSVVVALVQEMTVKPGKGWVRGDNAMDPKLLEELALSKDRIAHLEKELALGTDKAMQFPPELDDINNTIEFDVEEQLRSKATGTAARTISRKTYKAGVTWRDAFISIASDLYRAPFERDAVDLIGYRAVEDQFDPLPDDVRRTVTTKIDASLFRYQFEALGLIQAEMSRDSLIQPRMIWKVTDKGRQYISRNKARARAVVV